MQTAANVTYLICVDACSNHNKFYKMIPCGDRFTVEYGRVGSTGIKRTYPIAQWNNKYHEKLGKGYVDQTHLHHDIVIEENEDGYKLIEDLSVKTFVSRLRKWANEKIKASYTISSKSVTEQMILEAQEIINSMTRIDNVWYFNQKLIELYKALPRKIKNIDDTLARDSSDFTSIIQNEQDLLEVMKSQVETDAIKSRIQNCGNSTSSITILEAMGLDIRPCSEEEIENIKSHLTDESAGHFKAAYRVINKKREEAFNNYVKQNHIKNIKMFYHGSRNENIWSIITQGMSLNPKAIITGKMFGYGLYFAPRAKKSIKYTSLRGSYWAKGNSDTGILAVFKVAVGNSYHVDEWNSTYMSYREKDIHNHGADSLYAHAGKSLVNDEVIVYNDAAVTLRYLIELH